MLTKLYWSATTWMALGLISGLYYRELTRSHDFEGRTQLAVVHTHALALGVLVFLIVLALERLFALSEHRFARHFFWVWNTGLALTVGMLTVKGSLQVLGSDLVAEGSGSAAMIAGISGLGHIALTAGFVLLFVALHSRVRAAQER